MATGVMHPALSPGEDRGGGNYEEMMPEHLLHMALMYLGSYVRSRHIDGILLTVYPNGTATIWGNEDVRQVQEIDKRVRAIQERINKTLEGVLV